MQDQLNRLMWATVATGTLAIASGWTPGPIGHGEDAGERTDNQGQTETVAQPLVNDSPPASAPEPLLAALQETAVPKSLNSGRIRHWRSDVPAGLGTWAAPNAQRSPEPRPTGSTPVSLAELVAQPEVWLGRRVRVVGRLQASSTGQGCTRMACTLPPTAQTGDRLVCNRCFAPGLLSDRGQTLALAGVTCDGREILTADRDQQTGTIQVRQHVEFSAARWADRPWTLDRPYVVTGQISRRSMPSQAVPRQSMPGRIAVDSWQLEVQAIDPVSP